MSQPLGLRSQLPSDFAWLRTAVWLSCFIIAAGLAWVKQRWGYTALWATPALLRLLTTAFYLRHGSVSTSRSFLERHRKTE